MSPNKALLLAASLSALIGATPALAQKTVYFDGRTEGEEELVQNQYICVFKTNIVARGQARAAAAQAAGPQGGRVIHDYNYALRGFSVQIAAQGLARMQAKNPHIAFCEADQIMRIGPDKGPPGGGGGGSTGESTPWGVTRVHGGVAGATR